MLAERPGALEGGGGVLRIEQADDCLADRAGHGGDVHLLVTQLAQAGHRGGDEVGGALDLARNDQHRNGVGEGPVDAIKRVDAARPGGDVDDARLVVHACIAFGGHGTGLLVVAIDRHEAPFVGECVVEKHGTAAGQSENMAGPQVSQTAGDELGNSHGVVRRDEG